MAEEQKELKTYVWVAGPMTKNPYLGMARAIEAAESMMLHGCVPFLPQLCHQWGFMRGMRYIHEYPTDEVDVDILPIISYYNLPWMEVCHCLFRIPGESKGSDEEMAWFKENKKPIFHSLYSLYTFHERRIQTGGKDA